MLLIGGGDFEEGKGADHSTDAEKKEKKIHVALLWLKTPGLPDGLYRDIIAGSMPLRKSLRKEGWIKFQDARSPFD
jgi:hypothetical protein